MKIFLADGSTFFAETGTYLQYRSEGYPVMHRHDFWECFILIDGTALHKSISKSELITKGHTFLLHPENEHCIIPKDNKFMELTFSVKKHIFQEMCNCINKDFYDYILSHPEPFSFYLNDNQYNLVLQQFHCFMTMNLKQKQEIASIVRILFLNILSAIFLNHINLNNNYPDWLNTFITEMKKPENICLNINSIYKLSNFSHSHLSRLFKKYTGKTLTEYYKEIKLSKACMLLDSTNETILNIASTIGYNSLSSFNKAFKDFYRITPTEYRKNSDYRGF